MKSKSECKNKNPFFKQYTFNFFTNNKFLDWSKLKAFADDEIKTEILFGMGRKHCWKRRK